MISCTYAFTATTKEPIRWGDKHNFHDELEIFLKEHYKGRHWFYRIEYTDKIGHHAHGYISVPFHPRNNKSNKFYMLIKPVFYEDGWTEYMTKQQEFLTDDLDTVP